MGKIHGLQSDQIQDTVLDSQEKDPVEDQVIWKTKFLDVKTHALITDAIYSAKGFGKKREEQLKAGTQTLEILRKGLKGWENFKYPNGKDVPWDAIPSGATTQVINAAMDKNLDRVPPETRDEIAEKIRGTSTPDLE